MGRQTKKQLAEAASAFGRAGGSANTEAQNAARAANAQLAGRPRRVCDCCGEPVRGGHLERDQDSRCKRPGWHWETPSERRAAEEAGR